jgi:hypothetical protein
MISTEVLSLATHNIRPVEKPGKAVSETVLIRQQRYKTTMIVTCKGEILRSSLVILSMSRRLLLSLADLLSLNSSLVRSRPSAPAPPSPDENPDNNRSITNEELVIERLLSHGDEDDGNVVMRVPWFGFGSDNDTWVPVTHLSKLLVERYTKRNKMAIEELWPNRQ